MPAHAAAFAREWHDQPTPADLAHEIAKTRDLEKAASQASRVWRITIMRGGQQMSVVLSG